MQEDQEQHQEPIDLRWLTSEQGQEGDQAQWLHDKDTAAYHCTLGFRVYPGTATEMHGEQL